jgi:hypothetical protein
MRSTPQRTLCVPHASTLQHETMERAFYSMTCVVQHATTTLAVRGTPAALPCAYSPIPPPCSAVLYHPLPRPAPPRPAVLGSARTTPVPSQPRAVPRRAALSSWRLRDSDCERSRLVAAAGIAAGAVVAVLLLAGGGVAAFIFSKRRQRERKERSVKAGAAVTFAAQCRAVPEIP